MYHNFLTGNIKILKKGDLKYQDPQKVKCEEITFSRQKPKYFQNLKTHNFSFVCSNKNFIQQLNSHWIISQ